ncbi:MAG: GntR family transcriptional regulator [Dehalococcoidia bacterium]
MVKKTTNADKLRLNSVASAREAIEGYILSGQLRPDQRLIESELAEKLGLSRTPIREALVHLEMKGYLTKLQYGGYVVAYYTSADMQDICEIREAVETLAIKLACERATQAQIDKAAEYLANFTRAIDDPRPDDEHWNSLFHEELYNASGNKQLIANIQNLRDVVRLKYISPRFGRDVMLGFAREHAKILEALQQRDKRKAEKAVQKHLQSVCKIYIKFL